MTAPTPRRSEEEIARERVEAYWRQPGPRGESVRMFLPLQFKGEIIALIAAALRSDRAAAQGGDAQSADSKPTSQVTRLASAPSASDAAPSSARPAAAGPAVPAPGPFGYAPVIEGFTGSTAYRVHDGADNRIATCYLEENAQHITAALNRPAPAPDALRAVVEAAKELVNGRGNRDTAMIALEDAVAAFARAEESA